MASATPPIAILYDDSAYVEMQRLQTAAGPEEPVGLMGRQVAGREFLDAYYTHGTWSELTALVYSPDNAASVQRFTAQHAVRWAQPRTLHVIGVNDFLERFLPAPPASVLYTPCPPDAAFAWARRARGPGSFALCGVTHTLCSWPTVRGLTELLTAPFEPYDALICTSTAAVRMVRTVMDVHADYLRQRLGATAAVRPRLEQIPLGVNPERFRPPTPDERARYRAALQIADGATAVLFVGRFTAHAKAHPLPMFQGLARAAQATGQPVHLILSGWAPNDTLLRLFLDCLRAVAPGMPVSVVNGMDPELRFGVWHAADLFTSLADNIQETFGLVVIEAMASGLPVVASDWDGYRDLVVPGETGLLVPTSMVQGATADTTLRLLLGATNFDTFLGECNQAAIVDPAAAAEAYATLLREPALRRRMGAAGRQRVLERFTWAGVVRAYEELWRSQDAERRASVPRQILEESKAAREPACYPPPEVSFAGHPTHLLGMDTQVQSSAGAETELPRLLALPLCTYVAGRRTGDEAVLRALLGVAVTPCTLGGLAEILATQGGSPVRTRATLAWLLKYGLLRIVAIGS